MADTGSTHRIESARSFLLGLNKGDMNAALAAFTDDATYRGYQVIDGKMLPKLFGSKAEIDTYLSEWLKKVSGSITYDIRSAKEWGDCVLLEWTNKAPGTGASYQNEGIIILEFDENDRINHARPYAGKAPMMQWGLPR